jgi:hypothetical protein
MHLVRLGVGRQGLQICDQVERPAGRGVQLQRVPADPHDEVGLAVAVRQEALQHRRAGIVAVADADLAGQRGAARERFGAMFVGQFEVREPAAPEVEHAVHTPVGACAAGLADAGAVSQVQPAAGPAQLGAGQLRGQQVFEHGCEKPSAWSSRYFTAGLLSSAICRSDAQAAV